MRKQLGFLLIAALWGHSPARADEGMWTYNNFPAAAVKARYGFEPTPQWLDHLRLSSVRIAGGCSASVVTADGLVMTNHHCARSCIDNLSGIDKRDYTALGFFAKGLPEEARCPGMELNQLADITNVTQRVQAATQGVPAARFSEVQKATLSAIEKECASSEDLRCEVVSLYRGGRYDLYKYQRFQDVRLVFAPEEQIAFFGGDPDNFMFPRYDLDLSFVRIYGKDGKPMKMEHHLAWSDGNVKEGDLAFVSGNPGGTSRGFTLAQIDDARDLHTPYTIARLAEIRGYVTQYQARGAEQKRHSTDMLFGVENSLKVYKGQQAALADKAFHDQMAANEAKFRAAVNAKPELQKQYGGAWTAIEQLVAKEQALRNEYESLEYTRVSDLFRLARTLVRYGDESAKPNAERLREFSDARLPQLRQTLLANRPLYDELEISTLTFSLTKMRENLGPDHPVIKQVFGKRSPEQIAVAAVKGSQLKKVVTDKTGNPTGGYRKTLFDGGKAAIDASKDPMIELARALDPAARAIRKRYEDEVDGPMKQQQELLARARFAVFGESIYPDATFTLRLSYGTVKGFDEKGKAVPPFTTLGGAFERHTGADPFALPKSWLAAKSRLNLDVPFNFVTTTDVIGGNSGSPVVNQRGEVIGLAFDGNIHSLGGEYGFDEKLNRTVSVHSAGMLEALDKVYGAKRLVDELKGAPPF